MSRPTQVYLGDGAYADLGSYGEVILTTVGVRALNTVVLAPSVWAGLLRWKAEVDEMRRQTLGELSATVGVTKFMREWIDDPKNVEKDPLFANNVRKFLEAEGA